MAYVPYIPLAQVEVVGETLNTAWLRVADDDDDIGYVAAAGSQDLEIGVSDDTTDPTAIAVFEAKQASGTIWEIERGKYVFIRATNGSNQHFIFRGWRASDGIPPW